MIFQPSLWPELHRVVSMGQTSRQLGRQGLPQDHGTEGFVKYASAPAARQRSRSSAQAWAVNATMTKRARPRANTWPRFSRSRTVRVSSTPSMPGICTSTTIASKCWCSRVSKAAWPPLAVLRRVKSAHFVPCPRSDTFPQRALPEFAFVHREQRRGSRVSEHETPVHVGTVNGLGGVLHQVSVHVGGFFRSPLPGNRLALHPLQLCRNPYRGGERRHENDPVGARECTQDSLSSTPSRDEKRTERCRCKNHLQPCSPRNGRGRGERER